MFVVDLVHFTKIVSPLKRFCDSILPGLRNRDFQVKNGCICFIRAPEKRNFYLRIAISLEECYHKAFLGVKQP